MATLVFHFIDELPHARSGIGIVYEVPQGEAEERRVGAGWMREAFQVVRLAFPFREDRRTVHVLGLTRR